MKSSGSGKWYQFNIKPCLVRFIPYIEKELISKQLYCMSVNISASAIMSILSCLGQILVLLKYHCRSIISHTFLFKLCV